MKQEDKDLLLKELCARFPYNCRVFYEYIDDLDGKTYGYSLTLNTWCIDEFVANKAVIKPYLFPLSSMTEEQCREFYCKFVENEIDYNDFKKYYFDSGLWHKLLTSIDNCSEITDWFNKNHFDYRGLIPMGLAIDATGLGIY